MTQQVKVRLTFEWEVTLPIKGTPEWDKLFNETALDMDDGEANVFSDMLNRLALGEIDSKEVDAIMEINMGYYVRLKAEGGDYTDYIEILDDDAELEYVEID